MLLHHRTHGAIEDEDALAEQVAQFVATVRLWMVASGHVVLQFMTGVGAMLVCSCLAHSSPRKNFQDK